MWPFRFRRSQPKRGPAVWGKFVVPHEQTNLHFFAVGASGSGKSSLIRLLMRSVLPDVLVKAFDTRAIVYDPKTDYLPDLAALDLLHETVILNPFDRRCSAWDIGRDIQNEAQAQELAAIMIPPGEGTNKFFYDAARMMLTTAVSALIRTQGTAWTFRDLLLLCANASDLKTLVERANLPERNAVDDFLNPDREARSTRMTLAVENTTYNVIAAAWHRAKREGRNFSITPWVEGRGPQIVLLPHVKTARTAVATMNRLLVQRMQQELLSYPTKNDATGRRTWVFLDEFAAIGRIPHLEEILTEGRSSGVCAVLGFQDIAHVRHAYHGLTEALLGQCTHQAYFRVNTAEMGEWAAKQFGRLITYQQDEETGNSFIKHNDPAATTNTFTQELQPAEKTRRGFECIIRSTKAVLPNGPLRITIPPKPELAAPDPMRLPESHRPSLRWPTQPTLENWSKDERRALGLPDEPAITDPGRVVVPLPRTPVFDLPGMGDFS